jgi:hypothetical protein
MGVLLRNVSRKARFCAALAKLANGQGSLSACCPTTCARGDSNSHGLPHRNLNPARLPIPPPARGDAGPIVPPTRWGSTHTEEASNHPACSRAMAISCCSGCGRTDARLDVVALRQVRTADSNMASRPVMSRSRVGSVCWSTA